MDLSTTLHRELHRCIDDALSDDPRTALIASRMLASEIRWIRERSVTISRRAEWPWRRIGRLLAVSHATLARQYGHVDEQPDLRRSNKPGWGQRDAANFFRFRRDARLASELRAWEAADGDIIPW
jgi:hypothetical protein